MDKKAGSSLVDTEDTLLYFSRERRKAVKAHRAFVEEEEGGEENPLERVEAGLLLGGKRFKAKIMRLIDKVKIDEEVSQAKRLRQKVSIEAVIEACESYYGKRREELVRRGKGKRERQVAIYLSKVMSGETSKEVGRYFGIKGPGVSELIKGIEGKLEKEIRLKKEIESLKGHILTEF